MINETYLSVSYFTVFLLCFGLGTLVFLLLRRPFKETIDHLRQNKFSNILKKMFFIGIVLPALLGFLSVSFYSCSRQTFKDITSDLSYLISKNQEQLSASMSYIVLGIFVWCLIVFCVLWISSREKTK